MGWLFGWDSRRSLVSHLLDAKQWGSGVEATPIAHQSAGYTNLWVVWELKFPENYGQSETDERYRKHMLDRAGKTERFIALYLLRGGWKNAEWGYKDMTESSGPNETNCPLRYLELVPDPGGYATEWRKQVRAYWAAKREQRSGVRSLKVGQKVMLKSGWKVGDIPVTEATVVKLNPFRVTVFGLDETKLPMKAIDFTATDHVAENALRDTADVDAEVPRSVEPVEQILSLF